MRQYLRDNHPFGFQIIEGEIAHPDLILERSSSEADISLALTRSTSYTLLPTSSGDWLSGLHEGAPSSGESSEDSGESTDSTAKTVPIARDTGPTRARSGASTTPLKAAEAAAGESNTSTPGSADPSGKADVDASAGAGVQPTPTSQTRRSKRLRGDSPSPVKPTDGASPVSPDTRAEDAGKDKERKDEGAGSDDKTASAAAAAAAAAAAGKATKDPRDAPDPGDSSPDGSDDEGAQSAKDRDQLIARLKKKLSILKKKRKKKKKKDTFAKETRGLKQLVDRAKAIAVMMKQTIDPCLWVKLPSHIRTEAYNKANREIWAVFSTSLGYRHCHRIG